MLAIRAARVFDGERTIDDGALVLIDGARIVAVEPAATSEPEGWQVADYGDATALPGLIDAHVHLCADGEPGALDRIAGYDETALATAIEKGLRGQLAAGVTTVRDLGDRDYATLAWRDRANDAGWPTVVASGPPITIRRGHCWFLGGEAESRDELRNAIDERAERGVDVVKLMASGGAMTPGTDVMRCQYETDDVRAVVEHAHDAGLPVTAHAHGLPAVEQVLAAGVDGIEHCSCITESGISMSDQLVERLAASRVVVCPTLGKTAGGTPPPGVLEIMKRTGMTWEARLAQVARMHHAGVRLISGADAGIHNGKPHGILPEAVADLVLGGVDSAHALASATSAAADALGLGQRKGRLRAGYDADVLVVRGNPLADITALKDVDAVVLRGAQPKPGRP